MAHSLQTLPTVASCDEHLDRCVDSWNVHDGPSVRVTHWRCRRDGSALRATRRHSTYVLSFLQAGACRIHADSWSATVDPMTAVIHAPGAVYRTSHPFGCIDTGWSVALREDLAVEIVERAGVPRRAWRRPSLTAAWRSAGPGLAPLVYTQQRRGGYDVDPVLIEENVIGLFQRGLEYAFGRPAPRRAGTDADHRRTVDAVRGFLVEHLTESLDLDRLARAAGVSPYHLCRVFKRQTGYSIGTYLHRLRLGAAIDAMTDPSRSLSGIALDQGFYSHSHFTSVFSRHYGGSPSHLRAELCGRGRAGGRK